MAMPVVLLTCKYMFLTSTVNQACQPGNCQQALGKQDWYPKLQQNQLRPCTPNLCIIFRKCITVDSQISRTATLKLSKYCTQRKSPDYLQSHQVFKIDLSLFLTLSSLEMWFLDKQVISGALTAKSRSIMRLCWKLRWLVTQDHDLLLFFMGSSPTSTYLVLKSCSWYISKPFKAH